MKLSQFLNVVIVKTACIGNLTLRRVNSKQSKRFEESMLSRINAS